ncbi:hypothetical protein, partial [Acinetobacter baumannii]|uniref:hypothetical protein n=1 Tax=Acinetobacter baumannii TaxID=470 RepID=UPI0011B1C896
MVQDGVLGNCAQTTTLPDDIEAQKLHSTFFQSEEIVTPGQKLFFPYFPESAIYNVSFLPHKIAQIIPFNSQHLSNILEAFNIPSSGSEALIQGMATTFQVCKAPPSSIETKTCATSIESIAEFISSVMGDSKVGAVEGLVSTKKLNNHVVTVMGANLLAPSTS